MFNSVNYDKLNMRKMSNVYMRKMITKLPVENKRALSEQMSVLPSEYFR